VSAERFTATTDASIETPSSDRRGARRGCELFESLSFDWQWIGVTVFTARDVQRELRRGREPGVGSLLPSMEKMSPNMPPKGLSLIEQFKARRRASCRRGERWRAHERDVGNAEGGGQVRAVSSASKVSVGVPFKAVITSPCLKLPLRRTLGNDPRDRHSTALRGQSDDAEARVEPRPVATM